MTKGQREARDEMRRQRELREARKGTRPAATGEKAREQIARAVNRRVDQAQKGGG